MSRHAHTFSGFVFFLFLAGCGWAEAFNLPGHGRLELFPVGEWEIRGEDQGEFKIQLKPKSPRANAGATITVTAGGPDAYPTSSKLARKVAETGRRIAESGQFMESTAPVKPFYSKQGFGYYFTFTDPNLVGKAPVPGDYKQVTMGMIRLAPGVMVEVQLLSDGEKTGEFQQLLGMIEGLELREK